MKITEAERRLANIILELEASGRAEDAEALRHIYTVSVGRKQLLTEASRLMRNEALRTPGAGGPLTRQSLARRSSSLGDITPSYGKSLGEHGD